MFSIKLEKDDIQDFDFRWEQALLLRSDPPSDKVVKRKTGECFQWKANGSCSKGDSCSFLHSHASENRETSAEEVKNTGVSGLKPAVDNERRRKGKGQASSSVPTGKRQTDDRRPKSLKASPGTKAKKKSLSVEDKMNKIVVVKSLPKDAFVAIVAYFDMLMVRGNPARGRKKRVLKEQLRF